MKHARKDYNAIQDTSGKLGIPDDEPVFILRGQDVFAPELLLRWAAKLRLTEGDPIMARMVEDHAQEMIVWQRKGNCKIPDLPKEKGFFDIIYKGFNTPALFISDKEITIQQTTESSSEGKTIKIINGDSILLELSMVKNQLSIDEKYSVNGIFKMTKNNPELLATLTITKVF